MNTEKIDKGRNYLGEVWLPNDEKQKHPCVLSLDNNIIVLKTNLVSPDNNKIFGYFEAFGDSVFLNCLNIGYSFYETKYFLYSYNKCSSIHNGEYIKIKKAFIRNDTIGKWQYSCNNIKEETKYEKVNGVALKTIIKRFPNYVESYIDIEFDDLKNFSDIIDIYDNFQRMIFFFSGELSPFREFNVYLGSNGNPISVFFHEKERNNITFHGLVKTRYEYVEKKVVQKLFNSLCIRNEGTKFLHCFNQLMENSITKGSTDHQIFSTSIISYQAFFENYLKEDYNKNINKPKGNNVPFNLQLQEKRDVFKKIKKFEDRECKECQEEKCKRCKEIKIEECKMENCKNGELNNFLQKIVKTRNNYVHGKNSYNETRKQIFHTSKELNLYSFLISSVVAYSLLEYILKEPDNKLKESDNKLLQVYARNSKIKFLQISNSKEFKVCENN